MQRYYRKVIRLTAENSPNVRAKRRVVPGVLSLEEYQQRRATWDKQRQCVGLDAQWYTGASVMMYPAEWRARAVVVASKRPKDGGERFIGVDPAEGGDSSTWCLADRLGVLKLVSLKTPDTSFIPSYTAALMKEWGVIARHVVLDAGGGGKQHADQMRKGGLHVRTVRFGEGVTPDPKRGLNTITNRIDDKEERYTFFNRRAEMAWTLRELIDPACNPTGFALPTNCTELVELHRQMSLIPVGYTDEGRIKLIPKNNPSDDKDPDTLVSLIGHSPDEYDAVLCCVHAMTTKSRATAIGAA
jgi:hypothetical protein